MDVKIRELLNRRRGAIQLRGDMTAKIYARPSVMRRNAKPTAADILKLRRWVRESQQANPRSSPSLQQIPTQTAEETAGCASFAGQRDKVPQSGGGNGCDVWQSPEGRPRNVHQCFMTALATTTETGLRCHLSIACAYAFARFERRYRNDGLLQSLPASCFTV